ncbi:hypothetical protein [Nakamurella leprariae]|uniref:Uncharacterized protein n=1 Tax=Nakamurella leprariae TaxID=2803911 RepID=A0A939C0W1_9ACTN|nr:hypothetical protein [Nakamurella leprariae]MBM9466449.1 hypothetical protein [Nakamurella leprariae]
MRPVADVIEFLVVLWPEIRVTDFDGAGSGTGVLVWCGWVVLGLALVAVAQLRRTRGTVTAH